MKNTPDEQVICSSGVNSLKAAFCLMPQRAVYLPESKSDYVLVRRRLMAFVRRSVSFGNRPDAMAVRMGRIS